MKRIRTRLIFAFERGHAITGWQVTLGRLGTLTFLR
jgi:hypothetical protein